MAKCIRDKDGKVSRVKDHIAARLVCQGTHEYTSKGAWRAYIKAQRKEKNNG